MNTKLESELLTETKLDDIPDKYKPIVELIGIENLMRLAKYSMGDRIYFPKPDSIIMKARNRKILKEFNGYNVNELAKNYDLSVSHVKKIIRDFDLKQISIFDLI